MLSSVRTFICGDCSQMSAEMKKTDRNSIKIHLVITSAKPHLESNVLTSFSVD
jgi:hypothetical protein